MAGVGVVLHEGCKFELASRVGIWCRGDVPYFELAAKTDSKVATRGREGEGSDLRFEGEVVDSDSSVDVGQDSLAIFVDCKKQIPLGGQTYPRDILSVGKGQSV